MEGRRAMISMTRFILMTGISLASHSLWAASTEPQTTVTPATPNTQEVQKENSKENAPEKQSAIEAAKNQYKALAEKNLKNTETFLAENKKKSGVVTLPSGLQYKIEKEGKGKTPGSSSFVTVQYKGMLPDGTLFDSSNQGPVTFNVNAVIPGWAEALRLMKEGSKWMIYVPPQLAYGEKGVNRIIGPNQLLIFEIELIDTDEGFNEEQKEKKQEWEDTD